MTVREARAVTAALESLITDMHLPFAVEVDLVANLQFGLHREEALSVATAVPIRQREFEAGRSAARRALSSLGVKTGPILRAPAGNPAWPDGVVGSISHTHELAAAVVSTSERLAGVGMDLEGRLPLEPELYDTVLTEEEKAAMGAWDDSTVGLIAKTIFCAKESVYKCLNPLLSRFIDFQDVSIRLAGGRTEFTAVANRADLNSALLGRGRGRLLTTAEHIVALYVCPSNST